MTHQTTVFMERLAPPPPRSIYLPKLDESLGLIAADELPEVTPQSLRLRKPALSGDARYRQARGAKRGG